MVYFSYYQEYPIWEPAEGGYYYTGNQLVDSKRMSKRKAKKILDQYRQELIIDVQLKGEKPEWIESVSFTEGRFFRQEPGYELYKIAEYIGEGESYIIERKKGSHEKGKAPYC